MKRIIISCLVACCLLPALAQRRIGVLLPFQGTGTLSQSMVEFYRGMLMAADSMRHRGVDVEFYAQDAGTTEHSMAQLLQQPEMQQMDVIVGPGVAAQAGVLGDFCRQHGIQLLMPFNTPFAALPQSPVVYQCVAAQDVVFEDVAQLILDKFIDAHFVFFQSAYGNERGTALQRALVEKLDALGFPYSTLNVSDDGAAVERAFSITRHNVVVADGSSHQAMQYCVGQLGRFQSSNASYRFSLLGYPEWLDYATTYASHFHALDTHLFTTYYSNPLSGRSVRFKQQYAENFHHQHPSMRPSLSMLGFDLGLYAMGDAVSAPLQNGFRFVPVAEGGGSVNRYVQLVHYGTNRMIQIVK